jgi:choline-sulfatase
MPATAQSNILLIMADQLAAPALPFYGHRIVQAPHMAGLAARGVVFENAYCASPLCAPSRFAMMTGQLPSATGAYDNAAEQRAEIPTLAHGLRALGYRTCLAGKMHFVGPDQLHGFEERLTTDIYPADFGWTPNWDAPDERIDWWYHNMESVRQAGIAEATNQLDFDDETGFHAYRFLQDAARARDPRPFFLTVSFTHPHDPYAIRRDYWERYTDAAIDLPRVGALALAELDAHSRRLQRVSAMSEVEISEADTRRARHAYYGAISYLDDLIGRLLTVLERLDLAERTIVIVTADHGDMLGERGLWYKMCFFEWAVRVPFVLIAPGRLVPGRVRTPVSLIDLLPTLLELDGSSAAEQPAFRLDGRSVLPLAEHGEDPQRTVAGEYLAEGALAPILMLRQGDLKLIWSPADPPLLYDLARDPDELHSLAEDPGSAADLARLTEAVHARWQPEALHAAVLASQRQRRLTWKALMQGRHTAWDFQPLIDASRQYMRNHLDLNQVEADRRYPPPGR